MVVNAPQSNILSAAEHTIALLLAQARNVPQAHADLKGGKWNRSQWEGVELHGKTLGIVGLGRVGVLVAQRAHAFGMRLVAFDPFVNRRTRPPDRRAARCRRSRSCSPSATSSPIHATKTPQTIGLVNAEVLAQAKPGLRLINAGRGGIVDEAALADAIASGRLGGAAIDTFATRADDRVAAVRARQRRRHAAPRCLDLRSAGQGRRDDRRAGDARAARRLRPVRRERRGVGSGRDRPPVPAARRAPRSSVHRARRRRTEHARDHLRRRDRRLRLPRPHALGPEGRARTGRRRTGLVRERAADRRSTRHRRTRDHVVGRP